MTDQKGEKLPAAQEIWDIGHSTLSLSSFLALLHQNNIELLVDVRRFPTSQKSPHFRQQDLAEALRKEGINYVWMGETLGGFRPGGYESWMKTKEFSQGLEELKKLAQEKRVAVMCAEKYFGRCHRRYLLKLLAEQNWSVHHLPSPRG